MFIYILRVSVSNVLKTFLNIIVGIYYRVCSCYFLLVQTNRKYKPTGSTNQPEAQMLFIELVVTLAGKKEI